MSDYQNFEDDTNRKPIAAPVPVPAPAEPEDESDPGLPASFAAMNAAKDDRTRSRELTFAGLRTMNILRCEDVFHPLHEWSLTDWATALAGEVGEACNIIKKLRRLDGADVALDSGEHRRELIAALHMELADVAIYLDLLSAASEGDLVADIILKFNIVSKQRRSRYYL